MIKNNFTNANKINKIIKYKITKANKKMIDNKTGKLKKR